MRQTKLVFALLGLLSLGLTGCQRLQARDNLNKGVRAFREANYPSAVDFFKLAIELDPGLVECGTLPGDCLFAAIYPRRTV